MALITDVSFRGSRTEATGGSETLTTFGSPTESFGTDAAGDFWSWTTSSNPGAGITLDTNELTNSSVYSVAIRFKLSNVSGYRKIIDYANGTSDNGFYISNGRARFYPTLSISPPSAPLFQAGDLIDLIATRDASGNFKVYANNGLGGYTEILSRDNSGPSTIPANIGGGVSRFGFFYDDSLTNLEYSPSGQVYSIRLYDTALTPSEISTIFPALDTTAPTLSSSAPADDATAVAIGSNIVLTFSETVVAGSGNIILKKADGTTIATIPVSDSQVFISGSTVTINPSSDLDYSTSYYIEIASGVLKDTADNPFAGISGSSTLNFSTGAAPSSPSPSSSNNTPTTTPTPTQQPSQPTNNTPADPAPAGTNIQLTDTDGDGLREVITAPNGSIIDGNRDGVPDSEQTDVAGLRLINDGASGSDYGALVVSPDVRLSAVTLTSPAEDGTIPVTVRGGGTVATTTPDGITNAFAGVMSFNVSGITPGGSTQATISLPTGLQTGTGNAYVRFNYITNRFEDYLDSSGNPLYSFVDLDGDGIVDAVNLTLIDGDPSWDGDGEANGTVIDPGFLAVGERDFSGGKRKDMLTGNILANRLNGHKGNDWLQGGLGADLIIGGKGKDSYVYNSADESTPSQRDTVKFGKGDRFIFSTFDGDTTTEGHQKLTFIGKNDYSGTAGELRATRSLLEADLDGDRISDIAINIQGNTLISSSHLLL